MRINFPRQTCFVVCAALAVAVGLLIQGTARSQESTASDSAAATGAATDAAAEPVAAGAEGDETKETAEEVLKKGQEALQKGDFQAAFAAFDRLARGGERDTTYSPQAFQLRLIGYAGRGEALVGMKEYDSAVEEFKLALDLDDKFVPALLARGKMYLDLGIAENYGTALADFQAAIKSQRGNLAAQFGLGKALVLTGNYGPGITPLTKVIDAFSQNENAEQFRAQHAEAYRLRGMANVGIFKLREAAEDLSKSLSLNPDDHETYFSLGAIAYRTEDYQSAADLFGKAIEKYKPKDPTDKMPWVQGHLTRAGAFMELGKKAKSHDEKMQAYEAARLEAEKILAPLDGNNPYHGGIRAQALYARGVSERMEGQLNKAVQTLSEAIELNPEYAEAYYRRGICYHYLGDDRLAIADFIEAANINFSDPRASLWLGFTYAKTGSYLDALRAYSDAIAASDRFTPAYINRGLAYMAIGEYDKALTDFNDAVRLEPTNAEYYFKRGLAYEALGQSQKASESFAAAIEFNDKHGAAYRHLSGSMQQLGRSELATKYRQRATELEAPKKAE